MLSRKKWRGFSLKNKYRGYEMDSHHITSLVFQFFFIPPLASAAFSFLGMVNLKIKTCIHSSSFVKARQRNLANIDSTQIRLAILIKRDSCRYEICGYANIAAYSNALAIFLNPLLRHIFLFSNHFLRTAFFQGNIQCLDSLFVS